MTDVAAKPEAAETGQAVTHRCLCESYARTTERAALAGARWLGRADEVAAYDAASSGMRGELELLPIAGRVVIGGAGDCELLQAGEDAPLAAKLLAASSLILWFAVIVFGRYMPLFEESLAPDVTESLNRGIDGANVITSNTSDR